MTSASVSASVSLCNKLEAVRWSEPLPLQAAGAYGVYHSSTRRVGQCSRYDILKVIFSLILLMSYHFLFRRETFKSHSIKMPKTLETKLIPFWMKNFKKTIAFSTLLWDWWTGVRKLPLTSCFLLVLIWITCLAVLWSAGLCIRKPVGGMLFMTRAEGALSYWRRLWLRQ